MKIENLNDVRAVLQAPAATLADVERAASVADAIASTAACKREALAAGRGPLLLAVDDDELAEHDAAMAAAGRLHDRAAALGDALRDRAKTMAIRLAEDARLERYAIAVAATGSDYVNAIEADHTKLVALGRSIVERIAKVQLAVDAANADLPEGHARLPSAEAFRLVPRIDRKVVRAKRVDLWVDPINRPLPDDEQCRVHVEPDGRGYAGERRFKDDQDRDIPGGEKVYVKRLPFVDFTIEAAQDFRNPGAFAAELGIPALHGEEPAGWRYSDAPYPQAILRHLAAADAPLPPRSAPRQESFRWSLARFTAEHGPIEK